MYLTKLNRIGGDDYKVHQYVRSIFEGEQRVLFHVTDSEIIVISENKSNNVVSEEIDLNGYKDKICNFCIRINPCKRDAKTRKIIAIELVNVKSWLKKKFIENGIEANFQYIPEGIRRSKKGGQNISIFSVLCFGSFKVLNFDLFEKAINNGIGREKGFGFGMLNVF